MKNSLFQEMWTCSSACYPEIEKKDQSHLKSNFVESLDMRYGGPERERTKNPIGADRKLGYFWKKGTESSMSDG
jgi:hypothetical protein